MADVSAYSSTVVLKHQKTVQDVEKFASELLLLSKELKNTEIKLEKAQTLVNSILEYVDLVVEVYSDMCATRKRIPKTMSYYFGVVTGVIKILEAPIVKEVFVDEATEKIFDTYLNDNINFWCKQYVLKMYNSCVEGTPENICQEVAKKLSFHMYRLVDSLSIAGSFEVQWMLMETIFRIYSTQITSKNLQYLVIPASLELDKAIKNISMENFDTDVRAFLNKCNEDSTNIYSISCRVMLGDDICQPLTALHEDNDIWVDFSIIMGNISWCYDTGEGCSNQITVLSQDVTKVNLERTKHSTKIVVHYKNMLLSEVPQTKKFLQSVNKNITFSIYNESSKLTKLITHVLPSLFGRRFQHTSERVAKTKTSIYKPLSSSRYSSFHRSSPRVPSSKSKFRNSSLVQNKKTPNSNSFNTSKQHISEFRWCSPVVTSSSNFNSSSIEVIESKVSELATNLNTSNILNDSSIAFSLKDIDVSSTNIYKDAFFKSSEKIVQKSSSLHNESFLIDEYTEISKGNSSVFDYSKSSATKSIREASECYEKVKRPSKSPKKDVPKITSKKVTKNENKNMIVTGKISGYFKVNEKTPESSVKNYRKCSKYDIPIIANNQQIDNQIVRVTPKKKIKNSSKGTHKFSKPIIIDDEIQKVDSPVSTQKSGELSSNVNQNLLINTQEFDIQEFGETTKVINEKKTEDLAISTREFDKVTSMEKPHKVLPTDTHELTGEKQKEILPIATQELGDTTNKTDDLSVNTREFDEAASIEKHHKVLPIDTHELKGEKQKDTTNKTDDLSVNIQEFDEVMSIEKQHNVLSSDTHELKGEKRKEILPISTQELGDTTNKTDDLSVNTREFDEATSIEKQDATTKTSKKGKKNLHVKKNKIYSSSQDECSQNLDKNVINEIETLGLSTKGLEENKNDVTTKSSHIKIQKRKLYDPEDEYPDTEIDSSKHRIVTKRQDQQLKKLSCFKSKKPLTGIERINNTTTLAYLEEITNNAKKLERKQDELYDLTVRNKSKTREGFAEIPSKYFAKKKQTTPLKRKLTSNIEHNPLPALEIDNRVSKSPEIVVEQRKENKKITVLQDVVVKPRGSIATEELGDTGDDLSINTREFDESASTEKQDKVLPVDTQELEDKKTKESPDVTREFDKATSIEKQHQVDTREMKSSAFNTQQFHELPDIIDEAQNEDLLIDKQTNENQEDQEFDTPSNAVNIFTPRKLKTKSTDSENESECVRFEVVALVHASLDGIRNEPKNKICSQSQKSRNLDEIEKTVNDEVFDESQEAYATKRSEEQKIDMTIKTSQKDKRKLYVKRNKIYSSTSQDECSQNLGKTLGLTTGINRKTMNEVFDELHKTYTSNKHLEEKKNDVSTKSSRNRIPKRKLYNPEDSDIEIFSSKHCKESRRSTRSKQMKSRAQTRQAKKFANFKSRKPLTDIDRANNAETFAYLNELLSGAKTQIISGNKTVVDTIETIERVFSETSEDFDEIPLKYYAKKKKMTPLKRKLASGEPEIYNRIRKSPKIVEEARTDKKKITVLQNVVLEKKETGRLGSIRSLVDRLLDGNLSIHEKTILNKVQQVLNESKD